MKKNIISLLICACAFACGAAAYAADDDCVVAVYENGALYSCASGVYDSGSVYADIKLPTGEYAAKAFFTDEGTVAIEKGRLNPIPDKATPSPEVSPTPTLTPSPEPTAQPTAAASKAPRPTYHPAYESEKSAVEAIAVVESVGVTADADENKNEIKALYRGAEISFVMDQEINISSAPTEHAYMTGADVMSLKKGDVIMITCRVSGGIKRVDLIARPPVNDVITDADTFGTSFENLFSTNGAVAARGDWSVLQYGKKVPSKGTYYAFGLIRDKSKNTIELMNAGGLENDALYLDLSENVIVYTCDVENKTELSIGGAGNIVRSEIVKSDLDDDDNVISWEEGRNYNYALVRVVDGTVPEMVVYTGYGE